ncbi:hypothetical protein KP77_11690 [Jeotgalibacillus alimentarius]|uniref:GerMN domain-containing protein n=1 Tax=Jeotgalibacillus alimentarius TaxID=135826 RepID=A0A0C2VRV2_9BACL|nr:hypothetical protein [Jeotgalibacillus alimentarius]KIL51657.1 hypothetical protein KP77_11690 [Jeotgalibacillus alimentarius]
MSVSPERHWFEVAPQVEEVLGGMFSEYNGVTLDLDPEPTRLILNTSFSQSTQNVEESLSELIYAANQTLINLGDIPEDESYIIVVKGENEEELLRHVFNYDTGY